LANPYFDPTRFEPPLQLVADLGDWDGTTALWRRAGTQDYYTATSPVGFHEFDTLDDLTRVGIRAYPGRDLVSFRHLAESADTESDEYEEFVQAVDDAERQYAARNDLRTRRTRAERHKRP